MRRICSWCDKDMGEVPSELPSQDVVTHGLCHECAHHLFAQMGMPLQEYLDGLGAPVVVVNQDVELGTVSKEARALLQKDQSAIDRHKGGDVFECKYAKLPGGCGNTTHCSGCTIRITVTDTFRTGQSHLRVPAYLNRQSLDAGEKLRFLISTEKVEEVVLLRIDEVGE